MRKFQEMCQEEFGKIELMARGGQKIVFDGVHNSLPSFRLPDRRESAYR